MVTNRRYLRSRRRAVRLATVAAPQTSAETLRYSASILPYAQVDLMFRSSGYVTDVRQVRGADGRIRDIGTGDYVEQRPILAHVRREDLQNQVAQAQAQLDQAMAQHTKADQDFERAKALYSTQSLTKPDYDQSQERFNSTQRCDGQREGGAPSGPVDSGRCRSEGALLRVHSESKYRFRKPGVTLHDCFYDRRYQVA